jgi:Mor family transcriptional regulator
MSEPAEENKYPEILADLAAKLAELFIGKGIDRNQAQEIAWAAAEHVRKDWSGMAVYIPKGHEYEISKRDLLIYRRFDGSNHARVAHEFDLTERQVYTIVKRVREVEFHKRQLKLFE